MKSALLIIDVQEALCTGPGAAFDIDRVVDRLNALAGRVRAAGGIVVLVQHEEPEGPLQPETPGWRVYHRVETRPEDFRVRKASSDAFHKTELLGILRAEGIRRLIIGGLQSELCVDSTVRAALAHDYPVVLVSDAHSTLDGGGLTAAQISAHHNYALAQVASPDAKVTVVPAAEVAPGSGLSNGEVTEAQIVRALSGYFQGLFPKVCANCGRRYPSLRDYILSTDPLWPTIDYDLEVGNEARLTPAGGLAMANCGCGTTLALSSKQMPEAETKLVFAWIRKEVTRRACPPQALLDHLRNEVRKTAVADSGPPSTAAGPSSD